MADLKIDIASVFSGKKAFADAAKSTINLQSQVKNLAKSYLGLFTAQRLARSSFNAVKAFAADDKAARVLSRSLNNLGLAFSDPQVKTFIADLEKTYGVLDDQLRPAFQRLLTTTGDVAKSQSLLTTALNLSAASGVDVVTVAGDLSKGYVGQTRALAKYGIGLTQAQLKAMSFEEVQTRINTLFGGQAQLAAGTYSGSLDKLTVAAKNAQEAIGKGLVEAFANLGGGGEGGLQNTIGLIEKASTLLSTFIRKFGLAVGVSGQLITGNLGGAQALIAGEKNRGKIASGITPAIAAELKKAAAEKAAAKNRALATKSVVAQTKAIKDQLALTKAGTLFDQQQTEIIAALKGKITEEERTRLELQLAILSGNTSEASKLGQEIAMAQDATGKLALYLRTLPDAKNPFASWQKYLDSLQMPSFVNPAAVAATTPTNAGTATAPVAASMPSVTGALTARADAAGNVNVYVGGSVISESDLVDLIQGGLQGKSLSGSPSAIGRLKGSFTT